MDGCDAECSTHLGEEDFEFADFENFMDTLMREVPDNPDGSHTLNCLLPDLEQRSGTDMGTETSTDMAFGSTLLANSRQQQQQFASTSQPVQPPDQPFQRPPKAKKPSSAASQSQKKYMQRRKQKMHETDDEVERLARQLADLRAEMVDLEAKERVMLYNLQGMQLHSENLFAHKTIRDSIQLNLLAKKAQVHALVEGRPITLQEVRGWSMHHYITVRFQTFIAHLGRLVSRVKQDPSSTATAELELLVSKHGSYNLRGGLASCWHWALLSWNLEQTQKMAHSTPSAATILAELQLSDKQQHALLHYRRKLLQEMASICKMRERILAQLGLEVLASSKEEMFKCPAAIQLHTSLKAEQTAVLAFILDTDEVSLCSDESPFVNKALYSAKLSYRRAFNHLVEQKSRYVGCMVLSSLQEAKLNVICYPICPDVLALCDTLAHIHGESATAAPLDVGQEPQIPLMPFATSFQMLTMHLTAMGCGKHLRRGYVMCPTWPVLSRYCCPHARQEHLSKMSLLAVCSGRWRRCTSYQWLLQVRKTGRLEPNEAVEDPADFVT